MKDILARIVAHLISSLVVALIWWPAYNWHYPWQVRIFLRRLVARQTTTTTIVPRPQLRGVNRR